MGKTKMRKIWEYARNQNPPIPSTVILSAIDEACKRVEDDASKVFYSEAIRDLVASVSQETGFPKNRIFPQRNYFDEQEKVNNIDCLTLYNVKHILTSAKEYCTKIVEKEENIDDEYSE